MTRRQGEGLKFESRNGKVVATFLSAMVLLLFCAAGTARLPAALAHDGGMRIAQSEIRNPQSEIRNPKSEIPNPKSQIEEAGRQVYEKRCAGCHGFEGRGDGPAADYLDPRPRDFTSGLYKLHSTRKGELPTDEDLFEVISNGMPDTSMPGWGFLSETERRQLVQYIKTFSPRFAQEGPPAPITVGKAIPPSQESIAKGEELFQDVARCFKCHGADGHGGGKGADELEDDWGHQIWPRDLTKGWTFRRGASVEDIYLTISTGFGGTPMDSAEKWEATEEEKWHVANFVYSLTSQGQPEVRAVLKARLLEGALPTDPEDPRWEEAEAFFFPLVGQIMAEPRLFTPTIDALTVKSLYNEREIAFLLTWTDARENTPQERTGVPDAVAIQFPVEIPAGAEKPYFLWGDASHPVNVWRWQAGSGAWEELDATGLDEVSSQASESQNLVPSLRSGQALSPGEGTGGQSTYSAGQWKVVAKRALVTEDKDDDIQFEKGAFIPISFAAWDGEHEESGARMSLSSWYFLFLEKPTSPAAYLFIPLAVVIGAGLEGLLLWQLRRRQSE